MYLVDRGSGNKEYYNINMKIQIYIYITIAVCAVRVLSEKNKSMLILQDGQCSPPWYAKQSNPISIFQ